MSVKPRFTAQAAKQTGEKPGIAWKERVAERFRVEPDIAPINSKTLTMRVAIWR